MMDGIVRYNSSLAVVSVFGVAAGEYKVLCAGCNRYADFMSLFKAVGNLGGADF